MHILYTSPGYKPATKLGGTVLVVSELAENLVNLGHQVTVYTTNSNYNQKLSVPINKPLEINGVNVFYFNCYDLLKKTFFYFPYFSKALGILYSPKMKNCLFIKGMQFDLLHAHMPFIYPTWLCSYAAKKLKKPFFYHDHGVLDPVRLKYRSLKKKIAIQLIERNVICSATTIFAFTEAGFNTYKELGINRPCHIIPNGVNIEKYRTFQKINSNILHNYKEKTIILYFGQLLPLKGPIILLDSFLSIASEFKNAILIYAGPDPYQLKPKIMREAHRNGYGDRVVYLGTLSGEDKLDLLARADIFCLPSEAEGFSISILEALASSTPVIITPGCNFPQIKSSGSGLVINRTAEAFSSGLRLLLSSHMLRKKMAESARRLVETEYTWKKIAGSMVDSYREGIQRYKLEHFY